MTLQTTISDGRGDGCTARVSSHNALYVAQTEPDVEPVGTQNRYRYYAAYLGSTGADSGTTNQNVNGSVTPQVFYIAAHNDYDIRVMGVSILIADTATVHNNFGNVAALANGWDLYVTESGEDTYLVEAASTGGQVIAQSGFHWGYGNAALTWELANWTGTEDAQTIYLPVSEWVPGGIRLGRGTRDRIVSVVNDDLTGLTEFWQRIHGYRHYP